MSDAQATATQSILITGCSSGIGHAAAHALAARGWRVFATARAEADVERLREEGLEALALDLADSASIEAAVEEVRERTGGRLTALFNNGAYGQPGAVEDLSRAVLREQLETNLLGTHELTTRVLPMMRAQGHGRIVQNSSVLGLAALPYRGAYVCSKFALEGLTDTLRQELTGSGIHISLIQPGPITGGAPCMSTSTAPSRRISTPRTAPMRILTERWRPAWPARTARPPSPWAPRPWWKS